jgi:PKD repeat protein
LFLPTSADEWRQESISLINYIGHSVVIKFTNITGYGNSLFIDNINVLEQSLPTANFTTSQTTICQGESIIFTDHANGSNLNYSWSFGTNASPSQSSESGPISVTFPTSGTYSIVLSVSNSFGVSTFSQIINVLGLPEPSFDFLINGQNVIFSNNSLNANSYLWDFGDGTFSTIESPVYNFQTTGIFQVYLEAKNSCGTAKTEATEINFILNGIDPFSPISNSFIFPNPNDGMFTFTFNDKQEQALLINVKDVQGRTILTKVINTEAGANNFAIHCPELSTGLYFLEIQGKNSKDVLKFVVE